MALTLPPIERRTLIVAPPPVSLSSPRPDTRIPLEMPHRSLSCPDREGWAVAGVPVQPAGQSRRENAGSERGRCVFSNRSLPLR